LKGKALYIADAHAWIYYLIDRLPKKANEAFLKAEKGEAVIFVPTIILAECVYLVERGKIVLSYEELFSKLREAENFIPAPLTLEVVEALTKIPLTELHDKIVVATAQLLHAVLITKDMEIIKSGLVKTLWE